MVEDGVTGLISGSSVEEFSRSLARLTGDGPLRRRLGANAKSHCAEDLTKGRILAQWEAFLAQVADRK